MDISAALTADEVAALSEPDRTCASATSLMKGAESQTPKYGVFEESLRLKNTLDVFEEQARQKPSWNRLSVLLNCEYQLYLLNESTPLRHNPFLSHWVEAVQRFSNLPARNGRPVRDTTNSDGSISSDEIATVRLEMIKTLLAYRDPARFAYLTPRELYRNCIELGQTTMLNVREFICMLEEEGIYERGIEAPEEPNMDTTEALPSLPTSKLVDISNGNNKAASSSKAHGKQPRNHEILERLQHDPDAIISELTHMPLDLTSLDFLTKLLQDQTLPALSIDPSPVIRDYIQHALRSAEHMGQPPDAASTSTDNGSQTSSSDSGGGGEDHGRAAQCRAIKLLLLFIRNLIRKALLPPEAIYFEIQEICVRYVWIREVREFRAFIENGVA